MFGVWVEGWNIIVDDNIRVNLNIKGIYLKIIVILGKFSNGLKRICKYCVFYLKSYKKLENVMKEIILFNFSREKENGIFI